MMLSLPRFNASESEWEQWLSPCDQDLSQHEVSKKVTEILKQVHEQGDRVVLELVRKFDNYPAADIHALKLSPEQLKTIASSVDKSILDDINFCKQRIEAFHKFELPQGFDFKDEAGIRLGKVYRPIEKSASYAPGGKASYPSTVLMNLVPALIAGVKKRVLMTPPSPEYDQGINPIIAAASLAADVDEVWLLGGAVAVAVACYGTVTFEKTDMITGPGNQWFTEAKRQVFGQVGIDLIAGPSELVVYADSSVSAEVLAQDLCAQAEHDEQARAILITASEQVAIQVEKEINSLINNHPRRSILEVSLSQKSAIIQVKDDNQAIELINKIGPEHLQLSVPNARDLIPKIDHAGAIFVGSLSAEVLGDYLAGSNHTLPTNGTSRFTSPLGVANFLKASNIIEVQTAQSLEEESTQRNLWKVAARMAQLEGLHSHSKSAELRIKPSNRD